MSLRLRLALAFGLVAILTAAAIALSAPTIVGRGFAAIEAEEPGATGHGPGLGPGPMAGPHAQAVQQETTVTLIVVALVAAGASSLLGFALASRTARPLARLEAAAASLAGGRLDERSGLADRTDELGSLGRSFDAMAGRLQADEAARRRFLQDAAHELKTPLAVIDATTAAILDGVYPHDAKHLETIRGQTRLLARIVDDLRTLSLADARALPLRREPVAIRDLLSSVAEDLAARANAARIGIDVDAPAGLIAPGDSDRLRQAIAALADNALRHAPVGGRVRLEAYGAADGSAVVAVVDSGPGIDPIDLPHVFDRFYQADPARDRATGGSGLGLAIVRAIVEAHGGHVRAANEPGGGARFELSLPAAAA